MDTSTTDLDSKNINSEPCRNKFTDQCVISATTHNEERKIEIAEKEPQMEIIPNLSKQICENQMPTSAEGTTATFGDDTLMENGNVVEAEDKMDSESSLSTVNLESTTDPVVSHDAQDATTPKTDKKPRARGSSESSENTPANKIAKLTPRATRSSQNPDFAAKQRKFLNRVHDPIRNNNSDSENSQGSPAVMKGNKENKPRSVERKTTVTSETKKRLDKESTPKRAADSDDEGSSKKKKTKEPTKVVDGVDSYCWRCHRDGVVIHCDCAMCPRVYHVKCVQLDRPPEHPWMCPECSLVTQAEDMDTRSRAMRMLSLDQLCNMLRFALNRMKNHEGAEDFAKPVDLVQFPHYRDYIVKPMDLSQLERNLKARQYGSTEAFLADAKWIVHNSIIFNSVQSKFTNTARALLKLCRQEMQHIENCPDCYQNSHTRSSDSWFTEACRRPHILVWAKLKGFPFWPAKVMSVNTENNQVDVRFFGAHDRAWIPLNQCYLYSKLSPTPTTNNKNKKTLDECLQELEYHIKRLRDKFGQFEYAPYKTPYDPKSEDEHLLMMLPQFESKTTGKRSRLSLHQDGARKSLGRRTTSPKNLPTAEKTPAEQPSLNGMPPTEATKNRDGSPMVFIPKPKGANASVKTPTKTSLKAGETETEHTPVNKANTTPVNKANTTPVIKKKTPLTAAAKKCFATDKICAKCNSRTTAVGEDSLCSLCSKRDEKSEIHGKKRCDRCGTTITMMWLTDAVGKTVCSSCGYAERYKIDEKIGDPNSTVRGVVTIQRKRLIMGEGDQLQEVTEEHATASVEVEAEHEKSGSELETTVKETPAENRPVESPPKFVIHKGPDNCSPEPAKKVSIVDKLQEKLCYTVIEALKNQMTPEEVKAIEQDKEVDSSPEKIFEGPPQEQQTTAVVILHDLRNDKEVMEKLCDNNVKKIEEKIDEIHSTLEGGSEAETDVSSCGDSDIIVTDGKKRKKNINNVVQNLKERKSSVDERSEQSKKALQESGAIMLDDSVEESSILIIDEGESSDGKRSTKSDKSRRKGIPAKVHSRSSTSTDEDNRPSKRNAEVLDETSGHFRRSSVEKDRPVTITVVTDDEKPQPQKKAKEIRSVNISKSLSLSVIKDSAVLEMECAESDADDLMIIDSVTKVPPRPTARKTMPNPPRLAGLDKRPASVPPPGAQQPPPLVSLRQSKPFTTIPAPPPRTVKPSPRAEVGPAHAKLEEVVQKVVTFVRLTFEDMLKTSAEASSEHAEALKQTQQQELEKLRWQHRQELTELKHNTDLLVMEMRANMEVDKQRSLLDLKHKMELEKEHAVMETKRKQWCATCQKEAQLYCCWNTAYCSYNCQQEHWVPHMNDCRNKQQSQEEAVPVPVPSRPTFPQMHVLDSVEDEPTVMVKKRRMRCGNCVGCTAEPCGTCYPCTHPKVHSVCVQRKCSKISRRRSQRPRVSQQLMPPPPTVPPFRHPSYPGLPLPRGFPHRNRGPLPLYFPTDGFCPIMP